MRNFVGAFDCIDKLNLPCGSHLHNKNNYLPRVFSGSEAEPTIRKKKRMIKRNYLTINHFGGYFRNFGISLDFSYLYKKTAFIVRKGDNCRLFCVICHWMHKIRVHKPH